MKVLLILLTGHAVLCAVSLTFLRKSYQGTKLNQIDSFPYLFPFAAFYMVLVAHLLEVRIDSFVTEYFDLDFTYLIYNLEGSSVAYLQEWRHFLLDYYFVFVYIFGYSFLIYFTPVFYLLSKDLAALRLTVISYVFIILMALPFFLFFPVNDTWWASQNYGWYQGPDIAFRLNHIWPSIVNPFFTFTTINNCLPSLHVGISTLIALIAWVKHHRRYAVIATVFAVSIPFATLYLGIHWLTDIIVGFLFAIVSFIIGYIALQKFDSNLCK